MGIAFDGKYFDNLREDGETNVYLKVQGDTVSDNDMPAMIRELLDPLTVDSNLVKYAYDELSLISPGDPMQDHMNACILDVMKLVAIQGHSGMSGAYLTGYVNRLLNRKPLKPLWDEPEDWDLIAMGERVYRHKRYNALFRDVDGPDPDRDVDAATFYIKGEDGYFTNGHLIRMYAKLRPISYPYTPPAYPAKVQCGRDANGNTYIIKIEEEARQ